MKKLFSRNDIMELLCITPAKFEWAATKLRVNHNIELNVRYFEIDVLLQMYDFIYNRKRTIVLESKINYKEMKL